MEDFKNNIEELYNIYGSLIKVYNEQHTLGMTSLNTKDISDTLNKVSDSIITYLNNKKDTLITLGKVVHPPGTENIFNFSIPKYRKYYNTNILDLYVGFRILRFEKFEDIRNGYEQKNANYKIIELVGKNSAIAVKTNPYGIPISDTKYKITLLGKKGWYFDPITQEEKEEYESGVRDFKFYVMPGIVNDYGIKVKSMDDEAWLYRPSPNIENKSFVGVLCGVSYKNALITYRYVIVKGDINDKNLILKYIGSEGQPRKNTHNIVVTKVDNIWKVVEVGDKNFIDYDNLLNSGYAIIGSGLSTTDSDRDIR
ncbi:Hypothetical protein ORPV_74 [Orpheovirus IHUMI-LCC2]|uniref:Uncharacterized protein n=1 Tax=Orpheovirus IHUMI-LCC2 TaxID=2023057 RepID=A0A2I2L362_9VIRU|nr:Hypothetical protein ORPV_74 [Orpheovirus IHUMI-LCC2]SNW61978.1 Hypothetical protein ORPV_74 [Orpheovirus IHUMI-LCC2]